ncbi:McrB family protein [Prevotella dentasini]|uniref:McrB family protein n=1 Tax=Prevotella dentasini TaxID=589537 RepID=UPI000469DC18|nr:AAA family ATPase [Prevotella dentasini]
MMFSVFKRVFVNGKLVDGWYTLTYERENTESHKNRIHICYAKYITYKGHSNKETLRNMAQVLECTEDACWFVTDISVVDQTELHFTAIVVNPYKNEVYSSSQVRKQVWEALVPDLHVPNVINPTYRPYITAAKSKPFLLLAGISGTGKSRIVRELARACWDMDSEEYSAQNLRNFEIVQVKPNWHDSSELIGYVSRVGVKPSFVAGDFLKFVAKAWENPDIPHFLCLDEMNLAPVEQYFAEYLSVIESRRRHEDGTVKTDPILKKNKEDWYRVLTDELTTSGELRMQFLNEGITLPENLIVVGTVNMDETTFSFSRKVLDRAMTIEMNKVDLTSGLANRFEPIGKLSCAELVGTKVEGVDVYEENREVCDTVIAYLQAVNDCLDGTPFKIGYRTRNESLLYVVNNLPYRNDGEEEGVVIARALDEITNMKILPRIEGDETKVSREFLASLGDTIANGLEKVSGKKYADHTASDNDTVLSISMAKLTEMTIRLGMGYTSFWS